MSINPITLIRVGGLCAVGAGLLFIGVQFNHPQLDANFAATAEFTFRQSLKMVMALLSLAGITAMYLSQVKRMGVLGLIGYLVFGAGYLIMFSMETMGAVVLPALAHSNPGYVNDVFAAATGGHPVGSIGLMLPLSAASGILYMAGGLLFGIALFRAKILTRWAAALLAVGAVATMAIPLLPQVNERLFAIPTAVALICLGYSLWRTPRTQRTAPRSAAVAAVAPLGSNAK